MPLQRPASAKKEEPTVSRVQDKTGSARSTAKRVNSGRSKRVDVSAYNSPIAKDRNGTFYYMKSQEEFMAPPSFEDRNAN
jgi:BRCT domain type II-containing protein